MLHPDTDVRLISPSIGRGVFATRHIPKGTVVWVRCALDRRFSPAEVAALPDASRAQCELYAYVDEAGDSILCWDGGRYINHSCDPAMVGAGPDIEIAARDLAPGDELTCEYGYLNLIRPLACQCGAANCRGTIGRDDALRIHTERDAQVRAALALAGALPQLLRTYALDARAFDALVQGRTAAPSVRDFHVAARTQAARP
jgi:hypothetical protein